MDNVHVPEQNIISNGDVQPPDQQTTTVAAIAHSGPVFPEPEIVAAATTELLPCNPMPSTDIPVKLVHTSTSSQSEPEVPLVSTEQPSTKLESDVDTLTPSEPQSEPLVAIPPEFWTYIPGVTDIERRNDSMNNNLEPSMENEQIAKGRNITQNIDATGGNGNLNDKITTGQNVNLEESKQNIESNFEEKINDMFCQHAKKNKCFVLVQKLTEDVIHSFQPRSKSPEIDPYSSIEEVFSSSEKITQAVKRV